MKVLDYAFKKTAEVDVDLVVARVIASTNYSITMFWVDFVFAERSGDAPTSSRLDCDPRAFAPPGPHQ
jgi:hypothetical protein